MHKKGCILGQKSVQIGSSDATTAVSSDYRMHVSRQLRSDCARGILYAKQKLHHFLDWESVH